jgi:hypothetical protein
MANPTLNERIVDLLNRLLVAQPDVRKILDAGIPASPEVIAMTEISCRDCGPDRVPYLTVTGILSAIGRICGEGDKLSSAWNFEQDPRLLHFLATADLAGSASLSPEEAPENQGDPTCE